MTNGCGPCDIHGGACGAQAGAMAGCRLLGPVTVGNGVKPVGVPMPLVSGV